MVQRAFFALLLPVLWLLAAGFGTNAAALETSTLETSALETSAPETSAPDNGSAPQLEPLERLAVPLVDPTKQARRDLARWLDPGSKRDGHGDGDDEDERSSDDRLTRTPAWPSCSIAPRTQLAPATLPLDPGQRFVDRRAMLRRSRASSSLARSASRGDEPPPHREARV